MTNLSKSISYHFVWQLKHLPHYKVTKDGRVVNCQRMRELKRVVNGNTIGYNVKGKFYSLKQLRTMIEKITHIELPF